MTFGTFVANWRVETYHVITLLGQLDILKVFWKPSTEKKLFSVMVFMLNKMKIPSNPFESPNLHFTFFKCLLYSHTLNFTSETRFSVKLELSIGRVLRWKKWLIRHWTGDWTYWTDQLDWPKGTTGLTTLTYRAEWLGLFDWLTSEPTGPTTKIFWLLFWAYADK